MVPPYPIFRAPKTLGTSRKPRRRRQRERKKTKELMSKTIAKYGVLKLYTILSRLIQNKNAKSSTFTFPKQGNLDSDLVTVLL